jgi:hypothetical protein
VVARLNQLEHLVVQDHILVLPLSHALFAHTQCLDDFRIEEAVADAVDDLRARQDREAGWPLQGSLTVNR